jgi:hypothetical protein
MISNCVRDYVDFRSTSKDTVSLIAAVSDIVSIILIYYFFGKL